MAKFGVINNPAEAKKSRWKTYIDEGDGEPIRFLLRPWTRSTVAHIDSLLKDRDYIKGLEIDWSKMPDGSGERRDDIRNALNADYLFEDWENVEPENESRPLETTLLNKVWLFESQQFAVWALTAAGTAGVKEASKEVKNSET